jgi:hypothetical protein
MKRIAIVLALALAIPAWADEGLSSGPGDRTGLAVTVYNNDLALVKDSRKLRLDKGENRVYWREVAARIQPEAALLRSLDGNRISVLEQNFDFDPLTPQRLLEKSVGKQVEVIRTQPVTGVDSTEFATLLSAKDGVVIKYMNRIETVVPPNGRIVFDSLPPGLHDRPTLSVLFKSEAAGEHGLELSYLTGGLGWKADYVAELTPKEDAMDLNGWATLTNTSGTDYRNASLQLVAGDVNRVRPEMQPRPMVRAMAMAKAAPEPRQESLYDYHLYTLGRPVTLLDRQTKQLALLSATQVPVHKEYVLRGIDYYYRGQYGDLGQKLKPGIYLEFTDEGGSLGIPLPGGVVRVYKQDAAGHAQFVGEDRLDPTAKGEKVRLKLGEAFDISAEKTQTEFSKQANYGGQGGVIDTAYRLDIHNARKETVTVKVVEPIPGEWKMLEESLPHKRESAHTAVWEVPVPAEGKAMLTWKARIHY